jgi:hypothetical protein
MSDDAWTITLTRDEALVLADYLDRWQRTEDFTIHHEAERVALWNLLALLEKADDGTAFSRDYERQVEDARGRLTAED